MMTGTVTASREATIRFLVRDFGGNEQPINAIIDTGFNGYRTLPGAMIQSLGLVSQGARGAVLDDGRSVVFAIYRVMVIWDGQLRPVQELAAEGSPLVGMAMLHGYRVTLDAVAGGRLTIKALP